MAGELLDERSRRHARIEALMAAQNWDQAIAQCIAFLANDPQDETIVTLLARCQQEVRASKPSQAHVAPSPQEPAAPERMPSGETSKQTTRPLPTVPSLVQGQEAAPQARLAGLLAEAKAALDAGHHEQALDLAQRVLAEEPEHTEASEIRTRAQAAIAAREGPAKAEPEPARERPSTDQTVLVSRPDRLNEAGLRARILGLESVPPTAPDETRTAETVRRLYEQAQHAMDRGQYADAVADLEGLLALDAGHREAQALLSRAQQELQRRAAPTPLAATSGNVQDLRDKLHVRPSAASGWHQVPVWVLLLVTVILILHIVGVVILFTR